MSLASLKVNNRSSAQVLVFLFLTLISFRMLYGVPPVVKNVEVTSGSIAAHVLTKANSKLISFDAQINSNNSSPKSESSNNKPLAPYKTFKNKIIKEKSINIAEIIDLRTIKFNPETPQLISPSQGKLFLTTHSNAPPTQNN